MTMWEGSRDGAVTIWEGAGMVQWRCGRGAGMVLWRYGREQGWCSDDVGGKQGWCCDDMGGSKDGAVTMWEGSRDGAVLIWEKGEQHTFFFCSLNLKHSERWQCIKKIFTWEQLRTPRAFNNVNPSDYCSTLRKKNQILAIFENRKDL